MIVGSVTGFLLPLPDLLALLVFPILLEDEVVEFVDAEEAEFISEALDLRRGVEVAEQEAGEPHSDGMDDVLHGIWFWVQDCWVLGVGRRGDLPAGVSPPERVRG